MMKAEGQLWWGNNLDNNSIGITNQKIEINTPIKIKAISDVKDMKIKCGEPRICNYSKSDCYYNQNSCEFIVSQILNIEIPISYMIKADAKDSYVEC